MTVAGGEPAQVAGVGDNVSSFAIAHRGNRLAYTQQFVDTNIWRVAFASDRSGSYEI
ncbi:MAG TPA: hypothetical protein VKA60_18180 [Blastocatellia bacterium]|nr:hypothetical protein [Blastocatellia bacterium]